MVTVDFVSSSLYCFILLFFFEMGVSPYSLDWHQILELPASASCVLGSHLVQSSYMWSAPVSVFPSILLACLYVIYLKIK